MSGSLPGLRVLMTADAVGGVWTYALDLARGLAAEGVRTTLAVLGPPPSRSQGRDARSIPSLDLVETGLPLDWTAESAAELRRAGGAVAALAAGHDLVHLNSPALAGVADFGVPVLGICHSCVRTWWDTVHGTALPPDLAWRADLLAQGYARCDGLAAPTRAFARATAAAYRLPRRPAVVPNGRDPGGTSPRPAGAPKPAALTAGRLWDAGKGMAVLDRAAAAMRVPVRAAGPSEGPNGAGIALPNLRLLGRLDADAMASELDPRPIFVSPALYEPFGLAVLEAAGRGCALVLSDIATFRELWDGAALFVPPRDADALAAALDALAEDDRRRVGLGRAAAERARAYTPGRMVAGVAALYRDLLACDRPGAAAPVGRPAYRMEAAVPS